MRPSFILLTILTGSAALGTPAAAQNYPWCAQYSGDMAGAMNCGFSTYAQCMADVSGVGGFCIVNNRYEPPAVGKAGTPISCPGIVPSRAVDGYSPSPALLMLAIVVGRHNHRRQRAGAELSVVLEFRRRRRHQLRLLDARSNAGSQFKAAAAIATAIIYTSRPPLHRRGTTCSSATPASIPEVAKRIARERNPSPRVMKRKGECHEDRTIFMRCSARYRARSAPPRRRRTIRGAPITAMATKAPIAAS